MLYILMLILGSIIGIAVTALLRANTPDDIAEIYKRGYDKGFKDGCDYQIKLNRW